MRNLIILLLTIIVFDAQLNGCERAPCMFKVVRINLKKDYYYIQAQRHDSLFLILSKRVKSKIAGLEKIKINEYYLFDFGTGDKVISADGVEPLTGVLSSFDNRYIIIDEEGTAIKLKQKFHYELYTAKNLIGLYYIPFPAECVHW